YDGILTWLALAETWSPPGVATIASRRAPSGSCSAFLASLSRWFRVAARPGTLTWLAVSWRTPSCTLTATMAVTGTETPAAEVDLLVAPARPLGQEGDPAHLDLRRLVQLIGSRQAV